MRARFIRLTPKKAEEMSLLQRAAEKDGAYRVARRLHAVLLNHRQHSSGEIARLLEAPRSKVSLWLQQYQTYGWEALLEGHRSGRPKELSQAQLSQLDDIIDSGPIAYGFPSGIWTSPMIARVIEDEFAVHYHPGHVRKVLKALGFSVQRPRRKLAKADPVEQDRWQRYTYPRLKKKPPSGRRLSSLLMKPVSAKIPLSIKPGPVEDTNRRFRRRANGTRRRFLGQSICIGRNSITDMGMYLKARATQPFSMAWRNATVARKCSWFTTMLPTIGLLRCASGSLVMAIVSTSARCRSTAPSSTPSNQCGTTSECRPRTTDITRRRRSS